MAITTCPVRVSYTKQIFEPKAPEEGKKPKYSLTVLFDKTKPDQMASIKQLYQNLQDALAKKFPNLTTRPRKPLMGGAFDTPIKDGDIAVDKNGVPWREKEPYLVGHYFLRAGTETPPVILPKGADVDLIHSGCWCRVNLNAFGYDRKDSKGVTFGLNGVLFVRSDTSFGGGRQTAEEMFGDYLENDPFGVGNAATEPDPFGSTGNVPF